MSYKWLREHDNSEDNPYSLKNIGKIKSDFVSDKEKTREQYKDVFYYFDGLVGTTVSQSMHSAGIVAAPITLRDNYGTFVDRKGNEVLMLDMDCVHEVSLVKYDILGLKNIKIIKDTCDLANIPYPKSHLIDWNDEKVWTDMLRCQAGIFQFEKDFAFSLLRKFKPKSIFDMALVTASLRPSGASYRNDLMEHKPHHNPSKIIDEFLASNNGYLIYQEDVINFLTDICGFSGSEADNTRRAIGRKDEKKLNEALPKILDGYCNKSDKPKSVAEKEAKEFVQIISDAKSYMFGRNHAIGYCMIGYICAYLRCYYPYEFITSYLNNADKDEDVTYGSQIAKEYGINITTPKWKTCSNQYTFNKDKKIISGGISSIKYFSKDTATNLIELSKSLKTPYFSDVLYSLTKCGIKTNQIQILINIDYFSKFGNVPELTHIYDFFKLFKFGDIKSMSAKKIGVMNPVTAQIVKDNSNNKQKDGSEGSTYKIIDYNKIIHSTEDYIKSLNLSDIPIITKIKNHMKYLGYIGIATNKSEDRRKLIIMDNYPLGDWGHAVIVRSIGTGKEARLTVVNRNWDKKPLPTSSIIYADRVYKNSKGYWYLDSYSYVS